jgi:small subunit ribosomal protein S2e
MGDGGFGKGFGGKGKGGKGKGKGKGKAKGKGRFADDKEWVPVTKLGRLVQAGKIPSIQDIFLHSLPIKEHQVIDHFFASGVLKDEVMKIQPVQKQTTAGQRNRFNAFVAVGDENGHFGLGVKCSKEVANAIKGGIIAAKLNMVPVRRGYWGAKLGLPHTIATKLTGKSGSVRVRLIPAPRGSGVVGSPVAKKLLGFAGVADCFTCSSGHTRTRGNTMKALFHCLKVSYGFLTPDLWRPTLFVKSPYQEWSDFLATKESKVM